MTLLQWLMNFMNPVDTVIYNFATRVLPQDSLIPIQNLLCFCFLMLLVFSLARHIYFRKPTKFIEWISIAITSITVALSFTFGVILAVTFPSLTRPYFILAVLRVVILLGTLLLMILIERVVTYIWEAEMIRKTKKKQKDKK